MVSSDKKDSKEEPQPSGDLEERRKVIEEYTAYLRALLDRLRRKLN